jgi:transcriptional regulator with XRE-family HTH domain
VARDSQLAGGNCSTCVEKRSPRSLPRQTEGSDVTDDYEVQVGGRLRAIRNQRSMTLRDVEARSNGRWKAVVVGSYERADRSISVSRLRELASFYGADVADLLPGGVRRTSEESEPIVIDLAALRLASTDPELWPLVRFVADVRAQRGDLHGDRVTLRNEDARALAILLDLPAGSLAGMLCQRSLLFDPLDGLRIIESVDVDREAGRV